MNICINAYVVKEGTLAYFDPNMPLQEVVTSEVYWFLRFIEATIICRTAFRIKLGFWSGSLKTLSLSMENHQA